MAESWRLVRALLLPLVALVLVNSAYLVPSPHQRVHPAAVTLLAEEEAVPAQRDTLALRTVARKRAADPLRPVKLRHVARPFTPLAPRSVQLPWRTPSARAPPEAARA
jgi:hypothetical protein